MDHLANKIIDLLREEDVTMLGAKLALERAIQLLGYEKLGVKREDAEKK